jgi:coenzyme F420-reducing hydrogenase gamma subunit
MMGKCMVQANKDHPDIQEMIAVKGCPPKPEAIVGALHKAGIPVNPVLFEKRKELPGLLMKNYEGRPEFDESFFRVQG